MNRNVGAQSQPKPSPELGTAWILLCASVALHVTDEALTSFLAVYIPTVIALRERVPWLPILVFAFKLWITGLILGIALLFLISPLVSGGVRWTRPVAYAIAIIIVANALQHTAGTILGRTIGPLRFPRPMPGFYSSPLLLAASLYLLVQLRKSSKPAPQS